MAKFLCCIAQCKLARTCICHSAFNHAVASSLQPPWTGGPCSDGMCVIFVMEICDRNRKWAPCFYRFLQHNWPARIIYKSPIYQYINVFVFFFWHMTQSKRCEMRIESYQCINISIYQYQYINISMYQYIHISIYQYTVELPTQERDGHNVHAIAVFFFFGIWRNRNDVKW